MTDNKREEVIVQTEEQLSISTSKQDAILGHVLNGNLEFAMQIFMRVEGSWFIDQLTGKIFSITKQWFQKFGRLPTYFELLDDDGITRNEPKLVSGLRNKIHICMEIARQFGIDNLKAELAPWLGIRIFQKAIITSAKFLNQKNRDLEKIDSIVRGAVQDYHDAKFEVHQEQSFSSIAKDIEMNKTQYESALTTGLPILDKAILNSSTNGALCEGDTTVIMGSSNTGKTISLITMITANLSRKLNSDAKKIPDILLITHEGRPSDIKLKIICSMMDVAPSTYFNMFLKNTKVCINCNFESNDTKCPLCSHDIVDGKEKIIRITKFLDEHLKYIAVNKPGLTVEETVKVIMTAQERQKVRHGKGFDLLVDDYPALLMTEVGQKGRFAGREITSQVYRQFVQLALDQKWHNLLAVQSNRVGSKINSGKYNGKNDEEARLLQMEDVSEAYDTMMAATNVITLNRSWKDKQKSLLTFFVAKSRSSETGIAVVAKSNYSHFRTHDSALGAYSYVGSNVYENKVDDFFTKYKNTLVPEIELR